jgi:hypothetical protein
MDILQVLGRKDFFRPFFKDVRTWASWFTFLKTVFALPIGEEERELMRVATGLREPPKEASREVYVIAGRRSGKSSITALLACYLAIFIDWRPHLAPGETPLVLIVATDKEQAGIIKRYCEGILSLTPTLKAQVAKVLVESVSLRNGVSIVVKACNFRSLRGYTLIAAICEESAFWRYETGAANQDKEVITALRPSLATLPGSVLCVISTPYSRMGIMYEAFKSSFGRAGGPLVWKAATRTMNPTIDPQVIAQAQADDPQAAAAEWGAEFRADLSQFIEPEVIDAAVVAGRYALPYDPDRHYSAFVDVSGGRGDSFTAALSHFDKVKDKVVLDLVYERCPPFNPQAVAQEVCERLKDYKTFKAQADLYAADWASTTFKSCGVELAQTAAPKSEIYLELLPLLNSGQVELLDSKRLQSQLKGLERRARSGGRDVVDSFFKGSHDDVANACAGSIVAAFKESRATHRKGRVFFPSRPPAKLPIADQRVPCAAPKKFGPGRKEGKIFVTQSAKKKTHDEIVQSDSARWRKPPPFEED